MMQKNDINAILLAFYMSMFIILRIVWTFSSKYSTIILGALSIIIISISIIKSKNFINKSFIIGLILLITVVIFLLLDALLRNNDVVMIRLYEFFIYAVIPIILLSQIRDFKLFLKTYVIFSIVVFFLYLLDPINHFYFSSNYMIYGFQALLPAFFGLHIGRKEFNYKYLGLLELISLIMILVFANRMASIAAIFFLVAFDILYKRITLKKYLNYFLLFSIGMIVIMNIQAILEPISNYIVNKGYSSYSINATLYYLNGTINSFGAGRDILWANALELIQQRPIFGYGVGYFESVYGIYVHNFILEIILSYGIFGIIIYLLLLLNSFYQIIKSDKYFKLFGILLFCTSFPKLLTSIYIFIEPTFWMLIFYGMYAPIYNRRKEFVARKQVISDESFN